MIEFLKRIADAYFPILIVAASVTILIIAAQRWRPIEDPQKAEIKQQYGHGICYSSQDEKIKTLDTAKRANLVNEKIDWDGIEAPIFWQEAQKILSDWNEKRGSNAAPGYKLYLAPPSKMQGMGRALSLGLICSIERLQKCRNRNFWSQSDVSTKTLAKVVVLETIRDNPKIERCTQNIDN